MKVWDGVNMNCIVNTRRKVDILPPFHQTQKRQHSSGQQYIEDHSIIGGAIQLKQ
ncbi:hypothetical protein DPMN_090225 [Dreissena polymorpha]|uniref:Uncharacterized protein n=1 Tax=Dreissena polymorpha TaxID=45954 RepID=A0A9D4QZL4_DREPO|nr:hypothetical protein DPMN_090225 [Dreissena polymorpha]